MNLQQFDALCNDCCFSRSLETKQFAEKAIYQYIEDIRNIEQLYQIMQSTASGSTIFVISEYISKIVVSERSFKGFSNTEHVPQEMAILSGSCYSGEEIGVLFQKCKIYEMLVTLMCTSLQNQLDVHVQNSLCNTVGLLIQQVMMISGNPFEKFKQLFNPFFQGNQLYHLQAGLKLIQNTLQNIQLYSSYESYVSYRRIMFQVQGNDVLEFMATVSLVIKNCQPPLYKQALSTLKDILMFNFNVSYFELESDFDPNDQNNVSFPERLAEYFNDRQLIQLLFQIVVQYAATVDSPVALMSLKCLKRIVSARKRIFVEKTKKRQFAKEMYVGAVFLFEKVQSSTEEIVSDILEFNTKLNMNFGLRQIRFDFAFSQQWLYCLQTYCIQILQKQMKIKDPHIVQMVELMKKLVKFTTDFKLDPSFKQSIAKTIGEVGKAIVHLLLNSQNSFFDGYSPQNHKKLKHTLKDFFENLFPVLAIDLASHMRMIYHSFKNAATDQEKFIIELSLINHIVVNPLIIEKSNEEIAAMVQTIIKESLIFLSMQNPLPPLVTMSAMSLAENLFQFALSETDESIGRQRSNKTFFDMYIKPIQMAPNYATDQLLKYIFLQLQVDNKEIIEQALIIMKETIVRLKHHLYNDTFQQSAVVTQIKGILLNLKNTALQKEQFFPCRTLAAEILSILLFDSAYENYIESIVQLNQLLTLQPTEQSISIYLYEMLGYFRHVDVSKIFRLLIKQHLFKVTDLTKFILIEHPAQFQLCKLCLKLMVAITENKSLRFQYHSSSIVQIELVRSFQGILTQYIQHLIHAIQDAKVKQEYSSSICRLVGLVYKIMNNILKGKYISQACQLLFADRKYLDLLIVVLDITQQIAGYMIVNIYFYIKLYNKACLQMIQVLQTISSSQLQLFEIHPQSLTTLLNIVDQIQKHLLTQLAEEYRTQTVATYHQPLDKVSLDQTTEIVISTLEFVSEEQQLAQLSMIQSFILPLENIIENILKELFLCLIKGQCSQQTNVKITRQIFAIMCTYQQTFINVLSRVMLRQDQAFEQNQLAILTQDLDLRIKQQNEEQFKKNLPLFIQQFGL